MPARPAPLPFDEVALLYDEVRPGYSPEIVQEMSNLIQERRGLVERQHETFLVVALKR